MSHDDPPGAGESLPSGSHLLTRPATIHGPPSMEGGLEGADPGGPEAGRTLEEVLRAGPMELSALLELSLRLAGTLAAIHRRGVLHLGIQPAHVLLRGPGRPPVLIGFQRAGTVAEEQPDFTHHRAIRGHLAYMAPEHTGRTGRSVDLRADLYSLGATLYEAACGHPPFAGQDALELLYDHLARLPVAPQVLRPELPSAFSEIVLRLLEKEPERRYQSADGLAHDLALVRGTLAQAGEVRVHLGERDYPLQLAAPARLVGRAAEISRLRQALDDAVQGRARVVLVTGAAGVGKTSLVNELRPMVTARRGWFVSGKFDQFAHEAPTATSQAFRALGRLLLAEPEAELARQRDRILHALGRDAQLMCNEPEFALLLGRQPEAAPFEPAQAQARLLAAAVNVLRAVASAQRPLVMVLDDLQWSGALCVPFIEAVIKADHLPGLLLVGCWRDAEIDASHPLAQAMAAWDHLAQQPRRLALVNLSPGPLGELLGDMMRLAPERAAALAETVNEQIGGNPHDTVELLNALRRDAVLRPGAAGWDWDPGALRRYVAQNGVLELLAARVTRLPRESQEVLYAIACLGGQLDADVMHAATGTPMAELNKLLAPALEAGLLSIEPEDSGMVRLRHERVQQAVYGSLGPASRRALHLALARRLAGIHALRPVAARQFLPAVEDIQAPDECRNVARLMQEVAAGARSDGDYSMAERMLEAALALLARLCAPDAADEVRRAALEIEHHQALCGLGRFEEADALYLAIERRRALAEDWAPAICAQIASLSSRSRTGEALVLGLQFLLQLGHAVPADFAAVGLEARLAQWGALLEREGLQRDVRPDCADRRVLAAGGLIASLSHCALRADVQVFAWLVLEGLALWKEHGPSPTLANAVANLGVASILLNEDYGTAGIVLREVEDICEVRRWGAGAAEALSFLYSHSSHWFEPLEQTVRKTRLAQQDLIRNGEFHAACFCHAVTTAAMLDLGPTLGGWAQEIESGLTLARRLRHDDIVATMSVERQLLYDLRGQTRGEDSVDSDAQEALERLAGQPAVQLSIHFCRALVAALSGDAAELAVQTSAGMEYAGVVPTYRAAVVRVLHALALAQQAHAGGRAKSEAVLNELDRQYDWLFERAIDAPDNFLHLLSWVEAERAWALDDFRTAAGAFDSALTQVEALCRTWLHALIAERAGLFHLAQGMHSSGRQFISRACELYRAWGAVAKVEVMEDTHPFLRPGSGSAGPQEQQQGAMDVIDAMAILRASQAISSETNLAQLKSRVIEVVGTLTGATAVRFALWDDDLKAWFISDGAGAETPIPAEDSGQRSGLPLAAFRYAERTREPLLVEDATRDDRFARDPYLASLAHCSLLLVPIFNQNTLRAMLVLENRLSRGAFSTGRLDAVSLIAGQLAVSLENAILYDRLEQRVGEQTRALLDVARRAGMAQIATNVLHNVGNVLNSVNVSAQLLRSRVSQSRAARLADVAALVQGNADDLARFLTSDGRGRLLPAYLGDLARALSQEREEVLTEVSQLCASVDQIKNVVAMQQSYAGARGVFERSCMTDLVDDALRIQGDAIARHGVAVKKEYGAVGFAALDKTRVMQILVNLIENAGQAMDTSPGERRLTVAVQQDESCVTVKVRDTGCGITPDNLGRIFSHGFTTKPDGHGFGLHSCAVAALEMGGTLIAHSDGQDAGSVFTLQLPLDRDRDRGTGAALRL